MAFNPTDHVTNMRGKDYLEVKWRLVWFREEHPNGGIETDLLLTEPVVIRATVTNGDGKVLATGMGTPKMQGVAKSRPFEGAETAAIGRALAAAGYGTQFTGEEEGEHLADTPVAKPSSNGTNGAAKESAGPYQWMLDEGIVDNMPHAVNIAKLLDLKGMPVNEQKDRVALYKVWRDYGLDTKPAAAHAIAGNLPTEEPA